MAKTMTMSIPHDLSEAEAKQRIVRGLSETRDRFPTAMKGASESWSGNRMDFRASAMGQNITGFIDVRPKEIFLSVDLPFMLAMLAGKIKPQIEQEGRKLLKG